MTNDEKQELWDYIWKNPYDKPKEIQMFCGGSLSTIRKYQKIIQRRLKEKGQQDDKNRTDL